MLLSIPLIEIVTDECKRVHTAAHRISLKSGNTLWARCIERQVTLHIRKEMLAGSLNKEWTHL